MRVAALFDVHGNLPALEAVLADPRLEDADAIVSGGDLVAGPLGAECLDLLLSYGHRVRFVRGNADREVVERSDAPGAAWCAARLEDELLRLVETWPLTAETDIEGLGPVVFCHASPRRDDEILTRLTPSHEVVAALEGTDAAVVVCGHVHVQYCRSIGEQRLVNAGSVGMPYEGRRGAFWALVGPNDIALLTTEYDVESAADVLRATGSPRADEQSAGLLEPSDPDDVSSYFEGLRGP